MFMNQNLIISQILLQQHKYEIYEKSRCNKHVISCFCVILWRYVSKFVINMQFWITRLCYYKVSWNTLYAKYSDEKRGKGFLVNFLSINLLCLYLNCSILKTAYNIAQMFHWKQRVNKLHIFAVGLLIICLTFLTIVLTVIFSIFHVIHGLTLLLFYFSTSLLTNDPTGCV